MEILGLEVWLTATQYLSVMASPAPKAQHEPQFAWSLISFIEPQLGHWVCELKEVGIPLATLETTGAANSGEDFYSSVKNLTPFILFIDSKSN